MPSRQDRLFADPASGSPFKDITSPKLRTAAQKSAWYPYYAGYAPEFVSDLVGALDLREGASVLDPWNGSGTTTCVARASRLRAYGCDLNPALVVVAKARLLERDLAPNLVPLAEEIVSTARPVDRVADADLLLTWFQPETAARFRGIERAIRRALVDHAASEGDVYPVAAATPLDAFYLTALFATVRHYLAAYRSSNPTWIKRATATGEQISVSAAFIAKRFIGWVRQLAARLTVAGLAQLDAEVDIAVADSRALSYADDTFDAVITSPPYCTRIDYVVATYPELAVLGLDAETTAALRRSMVGRPSFNTDSVQVDGAYARELLDRVSSHSSKASASYYRRFYGSYIDDLGRSLRELFRVTRRDGRIALVVQDSKYKEIHIDVQRLVTEIGHQLGYSVEAVDFRLPRTMRAINPRARVYGEDSTARESLLILDRVV